MTKLTASVAATVGLAIVATLVARAASETTQSPHAIALKLVVESQSDQLRLLDPAHSDLDTLARDWSVVRPIAPGVVDSTHWFTVTYSIDGKVKASWNVNTRTGEIGPQAFHGVKRVPPNNALERERGHAASEG